MMNHKEKLLEIYNLSSSPHDIEDIDEDIFQNIKLIGEKINSQKGVFTVLTTLLTHKILYPNQDIRLHQSSMSGGFSGRTIDNAYITPTLKQLGLPSMAESGWLTRSLEQPYPYNLNYNGKISNKSVKLSFLKVIDYVQKKPLKADLLLRILLHEAIAINKDSVVEITPLLNPEKICIENICCSLNEHFKTNYQSHGGAKLPVIAFHSIYKILLKELKRYKNCTMADLGSHTASDRTSKTSGDIEIFKSNKLFESFEIKLDKAIDITILRIAIEKIIKYNPERYYILSYKGINEANKAEMSKLIENIKDSHGCQIVIGCILPSIEYGLRIISSLDEFINEYGDNIENDKEIKKIHKEKWNSLISKNLN